ncbi:MAG: methionyl-tRNA formyltransferase [Bacteroidaceae bacterium]|nr:methionyl-tRNA formyltransferase [Bacteroidaceae bacterium]
MKKDIRIVYMGTPDFAVGPLERLVNDGYNIVGAVTMPDKAIGRHHDTLQASPVKQFAVAHDIPVLQPEKLRDEAFLAQLADLRADLQVVVAFRMLPEVVWAMPRLGTFNLHAALLPQYRGAAPINWAIINGERETGVTTFFLDHDIDTGRILLQERCPIHETDTAEDIHDRLMALGTEVVVRTIDLIARGEAKAVPQEQFMTDAPLHHAPKIFRETCEIHWTELLTRQAYDFIRGLSPYPAAWTTLRSPQGDEQTLKVYRADYTLGPQSQPAGTLLTDGRSDLSIVLPDGRIHLREVQLAGKKRMPVGDFLRGTHLDGWTLK